MGISDPAALSSALGKLFNQAGQQALANPTELTQLLQKSLTPGQNSRLPDSNALRQPPFNPPQWRTLLVFLMAWIVDEIGDSELWLGAYQPAGWAPMLTLNYSPNSAGPPLISVGLAVTDQDATLRQGIWIDAHPNAGAHMSEGTLTLDFSTGQSSGSWQYDFTHGALSPLVPSTPAPTVSLTASWNPGWQLSSTIFPTPQFGGADIGVVLTTGNPTYRATAGVGPLSVHFDPGAALGPLAGAVKIIAPSVSYHPQVTIAAGQAPSFTLGN